MGCTIRIMTSLPTPDFSDKNSHPGESSDAPPQEEAALATIESLEDVLAELSEHHPDLPMWEYWEGAMTALLCTRRRIPESEWLLLLSGLDLDELNPETGFASEGQRTRFLMNWLAREAQIRQALEARVQSLDEPGALDPAVLDIRGAVAMQAHEKTDDEKADEGDNATDYDEDEPVPPFGAIWAMGFMAVVDIWEDDWAPPRDKAIAGDISDALECIEALCEDDTAKPAFNFFDENGPPSVSEERMEAFGEALWAVYDLYAIAQSLGPRMDPVRNDAKVGRNDPCPCGSGKKYKKCCGA